MDIGYKSLKDIGKRKIYINLEGIKTQFNSKAFIPNYVYIKRIVK